MPVLHRLFAVIEHIWYLWTMEFALLMLLTPALPLLARAIGVFFLGLVYAVSRREIREQEKEGVVGYE